MTRSALAGAAGGVLLAVAAAGCLDFVAPEARPARFQASLRITDADPPQAELLAAFDPGAGPGGAPRSVADPSVRVLGTTVTPSRESEEDLLEYRDDVALGPPDVDRVAVELEGPRLRADRPRLVLSAPLVWRSGPDSTLLSEGEDLLLPLRGAPALAGGDVDRVAWRLEVRDPEKPEQLYSARGTGPPPDTLEVQRDLLAADSGGESLQAFLDVGVDVRAPPGAAGYEASFRLLVRLVWRVVTE